MLKATCRREGRCPCPYLPVGEEDKALLWWKGHQLDLLLWACTSWQCLALGGALLKGTCFSIMGSSLPSLEVIRCRKCLVNWQLLSQTWCVRPQSLKRDRCFITRGSSTVGDNEMSKGWDSCSAVSRFPVLSVSFQNEHVFWGWKKTAKWSCLHFLSKIQISSKYNLLLLNLKKKKSHLYTVYFYLYTYFHLLQLILAFLPESFCSIVGSQWLLFNRLW